MKYKLSQKSIIYIIVFFLFLVFCSLFFLYFYIKNEKTEIQKNLIVDTQNLEEIISTDNNEDKKEENNTKTNIINNTKDSIEVNNDKKEIENETNNEEINIEKDKDTIINNNIKNDNIKNDIENNNTNNQSPKISINGLKEIPMKYNYDIEMNIEQEILKLVNQKRQENGLNELILDNSLTNIARYKSNHMIQYEYFDHITPENEYWYNWLQKINYSYVKTTENIAYTNQGGIKLFDLWWNSEGHRNNILDSEVNKIGISVLYDKDNKVFMGTQIFAK